MDLRGRKYSVFEWICRVLRKGAERLKEKKQEEKQNLQIRKNDWILIAVLLVAAVVAYFGIRFYQKANTKEAVAVVTVDGVEYGRYPLNEDRTERITLENGSYNVLAIKDGYADMTEASCPDQICVNHNKISRKNETIVCLPDKVVVTIENGEKEDIDLLTH